MMNTLNNRPVISIYDIIKAIALIILAALLFSCSSKHITKASDKIKMDITTGSASDSMGVSKFDSAGIKSKESASLIKKDSSHVKTDETESEETITVNLSKPGTIKKGDTAYMPVNPYEGAPLIPITAPIHDIEIDGHKIHSSQPIENVTIRNKSGTRTIDASKLQTSDSSVNKNTESALVNRFDSGHKAARDTGHIALDSQSKGREVVRTGTGAGVYVIIAGALVFLFIAWRFGWLRKKDKRDPQNKNNNTLTSVPYQPAAPPDKT